VPHAADPRTNFLFHLFTAAAAAFGKYDWSFSELPCSAYKLCTAILGDARFPPWFYLQPRLCFWVEFVREKIALYYFIFFAFPEF